MIYIYLNSLQDLNTLIKEYKFEGAFSLKIDIFKEKLSKKFFEELQLRTPDLRLLNLSINKVNLYDSLISDVAQVMLNWKKLDQSLQKQAFKLIRSIKRIRYPTSFIFCSQILNYIQLQCERFIVRFELNLNEKINLEKLKLKYISLKMDGKTESFNQSLINEIDRNDQISLFLYHDDQLILKCQNNNKFKKQIRLHFDSLHQLFLFQFKDFKTVIFNIADKSNCHIWKKGKNISKFFSERYNFKFFSSNYFRIVSLSDSNLNNNLNYSTKNILPKLKNKADVHFLLQNDFQLECFKQTVTPFLLCKAKQSMKLQFKLILIGENEELDRAICFYHKQDQNQTSYKLRIYVNSIEGIQNLLMHIYQNFQKYYLEYFLLKLYCMEDQENQNKINQQLECLNLITNIKQLKIINQKINFPFMSKLNSLETIQCDGTIQQINKFLKENKEQIEIQNCNKLTNLNFKIHTDYNDYNNLNEGDNLDAKVEQKLCQNIQFNKIKYVNIKAYNIDKSVLLNFNKFSRLVTLKISLQKQKKDKTKKIFKALYESKNSNESSNESSDKYSDYEYGYYSEKRRQAEYLKQEEQRQNEQRIQNEIMEIYQQALHDITCGYSNIQYCTCNKYQFQKLLYKKCKQSQSLL